MSMASPWTKNLCNIVTSDLSLIMGFSSQTKNASYIFLRTVLLSVFINSNFNLAVPPNVFVYSVHPQPPRYNLEL